MTSADLGAIRSRASSDVRWCAEVGVPPSQDSVDRRDLLAEVDRLRDMIDGQAWADLHAERDALRAEVEHLRSTLDREHDFLQAWLDRQS